MGSVPGFDAFAARKTREAEQASIHRLVTIDDRSSRYSLDRVGNEWSRHLYDGPFHLVRLKPDTTTPASFHAVASGFSRTRTAIPAISLVFVQSKDRNTGTNNPEEL